MNFKLTDTPLLQNIAALGEMLTSSKNIYIYHRNVCHKIECDLLYFKRL